MKNRPWAGVVTLLLVIAGLAVSAYLFSRGLKLSTTGQAGVDVCSIVFESSCDATLLSSYGSVLGLSVAGWGLVYFGALLGLVLIARVLRETVFEAAITGAVLLNTGGLAVSAYLSSLFITGQAPLCPMCIVTHVLNFLLLPSLLLYSGLSPKSVVAHAQAAFNFIFGPSVQADTTAKLRMVSFVTVALAAVVLYQGLILYTHAAAGDKGDGPSAGEIISAHFAQDPIDVPTDDNDPRLGPADAPVEIVVFSDFQCPACRNHAAAVRALPDQFPGDVTVVFKNFPLGLDCNPALNEEFHEHACRFAHYGLAAHLQDGFWPMYDELFSITVFPNDDMASKLAERAGLDGQQLLADAKTPEVDRMLREDIDLGIDLGIIQTPTVYLNGRPVPFGVMDRIDLLIGASLSRGERADKNEAP